MIRLFLVYCITIVSYMALADLKRGKLGESARKETTTEKKAITCPSWYAHSIGSMSTVEGDLYKQLYVSKLVEDNKKHYVLEELNLKDMTSNVIVTLSMPDVHQVLFSNVPGEGVTFVSYSRNSDQCFDGPAKIKALSLVTNKRLKNKVMGLNFESIVASYDVGDSQLLFDKKNKFAIQIIYNPLVRHNYEFNSLSYGRPLLVSDALGKKGAVFANISRDNVVLTKIDGKGEKISELNLKLDKGDRLIRKGKGFGVIRSNKENNQLSILFSREWSVDGRNSVYKVKTPNSVNPRRLTPFFSASSKILFLAGSSKFIREQWNRVLVVDYKNDRVLSELKLANKNIPGEIRLVKNGSFGIVEEVDAKTGIRIALHVIEMKNLKWKKKVYSVL